MKNPAYSKDTLLKVLVADDSELFRKLLISDLSDIHGVEIIGQAESGPEAQATKPARARRNPLGTRMLFFTVQPLKKEDRRRPREVFRGEARTRGALRPPSL